MMIKLSGVNRSVKSSLDVSNENINNPNFPMALTERSTLSFDYNSFSSSDESNSESEDESNKEETYVQDGKYIENGEDSKLRNWKKWIENRKMIQNRFTSVLKRKPDQMIMNSDDKYEKTRKANFIDSAEKYKKFDKYRGDPKFWVTPNYLYDLCENDTPLSCPVEDKFDRTVVDKNEVPTLEYISIPKLIKCEKGLLENVEDPIVEKTTYHKCDYFSEKVKKLEENVDLIERSVPNMELFVVGEHLPSSPRLVTPSIKALRTDVEITIDRIICKDENYHNFYAKFPSLKVQGKLIDIGIIGPLYDDFKQVVNFLDCSVNELYAEKLVIENIGNMCVRYAWSQEEPYRNAGFPLRYTTQHIKRFFFPTKSGIFIPGQITEIPVWFKSREPGVYHESWRLVMNPKFPNNKTVKFSFQGFVRAESDQKKLLKIKSYIERCKVVSVARELTNVVITDSKLENPVPYHTLFMYKDVFLHNNPNHFYEFDKVQSLIKLNETITGSSDWDLSINKLRNQILIKTKAVDEKRKYLLELYDISKSLLKLNKELDLNEEKYRSVYQILCSLANKIEKEAKWLRPIYRISDYVRASVISTTSLREPVSGSFSQFNIGQGGSVGWSGRKSRRPSSLVKRHKRSSQKTSRDPISTTIQETIPENSVSNVAVAESDPESKRLHEIRKNHYVKTLSIKTYQHLLTAVDEITAVIETLNTFLKPKKLSY